MSCVSNPAGHQLYVIYVATLIAVAPASWDVWPCRSTDISTHSDDGVDILQLMPSC